MINFNKIRADSKWFLGSSVNYWKINWCLFSSAALGSSERNERNVSSRFPRTRCKIRGSTPPESRSAEGRELAENTDSWAPALGWAQDSAFSQALQETLMWVVRTLGVWGSLERNLASSCGMQRCKGLVLGGERGILASGTGWEDAEVLKVAALAKGPPGGRSSVGWLCEGCGSWTLSPAVLGKRSLGPETGLHQWREPLTGICHPSQKAVVGGGIVHDGDNVSSKHFSHSLVPGLIVLNTLSYRSHYYSHFTDGTLRHNLPKVTQPVKGRTGIK